MAYKKWVVREADKERASALSEKFNIDPFVAFLLVSRGIDDDLTVSSFLSDSFETVSPFNFTDMEEAAFTIGDAVDNGEKICIYGDYDCDGVTSTALLMSYLRSEGADVFAYIPDRLSEGYGLNIGAIDKIKEKGANLIVTVDNGISSVDEAEYIYSLGMRLVVTDHHQIGEALPRAEAVVNPHREENSLSFREYCGVGVAFKLICAMHEGDINDLVNEYIDLVAIGTIADVVPLLHENRAFVRAGINKINTNPRESIRAFINSNGEKQYTANDIAFQLCPRINAMGRMGDAMRAVEFLICEDKDECAFKYEQLSVENSHRQEIERNILEDVKNKIANNPKLVSERVIVIDGRDYHHGVTGIVASHVLEEYSKPTFIISVDENGVARGSARSISGFNIFDAISVCSEDLIQFGGHPLAAGITLSEDNIDLFRKHINEYALREYPIMPPQELVIDCRISPRYLNLELADNLALLEPCGAENPRAVFGLYNLTLAGITPLSEGKHIRLDLEKRINNRVEKIRVAKFSTTPDEFPFKVGDVLNLAVKVSKNFYKERTYLSVQAVDIRLAKSDDEKYFLEKNTYELYKLTGKAEESLYPSREICSTVYRYLKANNGYNYTLDDLYFRLQEKLSYGQLMHSIKAFAQAGLISVGDRITLNESSKKVNLEETRVLKTLKGRLNFEH